MSLRIEIFLPDDNVSPSALNSHMETLGFDRLGRLAASTNLQAFGMATEMVRAVENSTAAAEAPTSLRERGKPAPGRARRTKEEIAEDEAAEKADPSQTMAISTGETRTAPDDDPATEAQDKADEIAESEAKKDTAPALTVLDGKAALGEYIQKFGMDAAAADGAKIFVAALGAAPTGETSWKWPLIVDLGQDKLDLAVKAWRAAAAADKRYGAA